MEEEPHPLRGRPVTVRQQYPWSRWQERLLERQARNPTNMLTEEQERQQFLKNKRKRKLQKLARRKSQENT
jgi:hypothetical protein